MLQAATGDYYGSMSKKAVVTAPGQKPSSKNAPTNHIYELMGVRLAVTDETAEGERVDLGLVLGLTGGGTVNARCLYVNNVEFTITHTPFVQTNYPPAMSAVAIKENVRRRLRVIPFPNSYVGADTFDPTNATHRLRDDGLKDRMKEEESLRQVLSWIARGSTEWYASANGFGSPPRGSAEVQLVSMSARRTSCSYFWTSIAMSEKGFRLCRPNSPPSFASSLRRELPTRNWLGAWKRGVQKA